jgi:hypothetical protein
MGSPSTIGALRETLNRAMTFAVTAAHRSRVAQGCDATSLRDDADHLIRWHLPIPLTPLANGVLGSVLEILQH